VISEIRRPDVETMISQGFKNRLKGLTVKYNPQDDHHIDFEKMNEWGFRKNGTSVSVQRNAHFV